MGRGGVAKTYTNYYAKGVPFMDGDKEQIIVVHPKTGKEKIVRWYSDKAHDGMHPIGYKEEVPSVYKHWGFETEDDWQWVIDQRWFTEDEADIFRRSPDWKACALFGPAYGTKDEWWKVGCWFAAKTVEFPEIAADKKNFKKKTWRDFVEASYEHTKKEGVFDPERYWGLILKDLNERGI